MKCPICNSRITYYFSKQFNAFGLAKADYWRCPKCGFSISKTHADMTSQEWAALNYNYHVSYLGKDSNPDDPRWVERLQTQAIILKDAAEIGLLAREGDWLDYACGDGKLSDLLQSKGQQLLKYDRYMLKRSDYLKEEELSSRKFDFVLTTSVFEHFTSREQFDAVESLVTGNGVLGLHTLVCENIPCDPSWFYLVPVHCAFHTNKSMSLLFNQWGYTSSVYNVDSRLWLWFKQPAPKIQELVELANRRGNRPTYLFKRGFMDYWK